MIIFLTMLIECVEAVVVDGLTMGHPCCAVSRCTTALDSNRDRYCSKHANLYSICSVVGCTSSTTDGCKSCSDPQHRSMDDLYSQHSSAMFQLKKKLRRAQGLDNSAPSTGPAAGEDDTLLNDTLDDTEVWFDGDNSDT